MRVPEYQLIFNLFCINIIVVGGLRGNGADIKVSHHILTPILSVISAILASIGHKNLSVQKKVC
jgi:hypothetical protein